MSRKTRKANDSKTDQWAIAASKAREEIGKAKARISLLEQSVMILMEKSRLGEPWPGSLSTQEGNCGNRDSISDLS